MLVKLCFFVYFIPLDPDSGTQMNADPTGSGSTSLVDLKSSILNIPLLLPLFALERGGPGREIKLPRPKIILFSGILLRLNAFYCEVVVVVTTYKRKYGTIWVFIFIYKKIKKYK